MTCTAGCSPRGGHPDCIYPHCTVTPDDVDALRRVTESLRAQHLAAGPRRWQERSRLPWELPQVGVGTTPGEGH